MPAKKQSGRKWTAAQKATHSKKIKKALRAKKNGKLRIETGPFPPLVIPGEPPVMSLRDLVRDELYKLLPAIIEEEVRSALS